MADILTINWEDSFGGAASSQVFVTEGLAVDAAGILALLTALRAMSQARITGYSLTLTGDIADITGNAAAAAGGSYDRVTDKAIMQGVVAASGAKVRTSIPCPLDTIFEATGGYAQANVDMADTLVDALEAAATGLVKTREDGAVLFTKGWRDGTKHS